MIFQFMSMLKTHLPLLIENEEGQDLAEYALVLVLIAVVAVAGVTALGNGVLATFNNIAGSLGGGGGG